MRYLLQKYVFSLTYEVCYRHKACLIVSCFSLASHLILAFLPVPLHNHSLFFQIRQRQAVGRPKYGTRLAGSGRHRKIYQPSPQFNHDNGTEVTKGPHKNAGYFGLRARSMGIARQSDPVESPSTTSPYLAPLTHTHPHSVCVYGKPSQGKEQQVSSLQKDVPLYAKTGHLAPGVNSAGSCPLLVRKHHLQIVQGLGQRLERQSNKNSAWPVSDYGDRE